MFVSNYFFSQEKQIKSQTESIFFLQKELESKQWVIDYLLKILTVCLHTQSLMLDGRCFSSRSQKSNSTQNNLEKSVITINDNELAHIAT